VLGKLKTFVICKGIASKVTSFLEGLAHKPHSPYRNASKRMRR
jgi:hypothetical protein